MSDEQNVEEGGLDLEDQSQDQPRKKGPFLSPLIIRILMIVALLISMVLISIVVVIIGLSLSKGRDIRTMPEEWGQQITRGKVMHLEYLPLEDPFREQLADGKMIQLKITLGYRSDNKKFQQELGSVIPEIRDIVIKQLSHLRSDYFTDENGNTSLDRLEEDLLKQINRILNEGKVDRILFQEFTLI